MFANGSGPNPIDRANLWLLELIADDDGMSTAEYSVEMFYTRRYCR